MANQDLAHERKDRERRLIRACEIANQDPELREIEKESDSLTDAISEPWDDTPTQ